MRARLLGPGDREVAARLLGADAQSNLFLLDLVLGLDAPPAPGEAAAELWGAWRRRTLLGVAALRPCIVLAAQLQAPVLEVLTGALTGVESGLVKSPVEGVDNVHVGRPDDGLTPTMLSRHRAATRGINRLSHQQR